MFEEGGYYTRVAAFSEVRAWVLARLLWNPELDGDALVREFVSGYYEDAAPYVQKYIERLHDLAFTEHPYRHTTIGLLEDIKAMPENYDYSVEFYDRYYRPNNSIIVVVGDFDQAELEGLVEQYYRDWDAGKFEPTIPSEPVQGSARTVEVTWPNATLPLMMIGYHAPAFSDDAIDMPALDVLSQLL